MLTGTFRAGFFSIVVILVALQMMPYGRDHTNPPVRMEPRWDSPQTRQLAVRACYDCHSNETVRVWYSSIAPMSWLVQRDVDSGRHELNFSEWDRSQGGEDAAEVVQEGEMPPITYVLLHPEAKLSTSERQALIRGFLATLGGERGFRSDSRERRERER